jgi:hypothetical protein
MFPRNSALAFKDADYANAIEPPPRRMDRDDRIVMWGCAVCAVISLCVILFFPEAK